MGTPGLWFDWTGGGFGSGANDNCTDLVMNATYTRGGAPEITGAAQAGSATFIVKNPDGLFDPDNSAGPLYGQLVDGVPVWWGVNDDGTISDKGATVYGRFAGRITDISPLPVAGASGSTPTAEIVCEDALGWYARTPVALTDDCSPVPPPCLLTNPVAGTFDASDVSAYIAFVPQGTSTPPALVDNGSVAQTYPTPGGTMALPMGWAPDDIHIMIVLTPNEPTVPAPVGWTAIASVPAIGTPGATSGAIALQSFWRRAVMGDTDPTLGSLPVGVDWAFGFIYGYRGCVTSGDPFAHVASGSAVSGAALSFPLPFDISDSQTLFMIVTMPNDTTDFSLASNACISIGVRGSGAASSDGYAGSFWGIDGAGPSS